LLCHDVPPNRRHNVAIAGRPAGRLRRLRDGNLQADQRKPGR